MLLLRQKTTPGTMFTDDSMTDGKRVAADVLSIEYLITGIISVIFVGFKAILVFPHL